MEKLLKGIDKKSTISIIKSLPLLVLALLAALFSGQFANAKSISIGPFEVVVSHHRYFNGWETGSNSYAEYDSFSLRYHDKVFSFEAPDGIFIDEKRKYEVFTEAYILPSKEPAVMVMVGDPNNHFFYYLIHEKNGAACADLLSHGKNNPSLIWLDCKNGQPDLSNPVKRNGVLSAGQLLLLNNDCVLNVRDLTKHRFSTPNSIYLRSCTPLDVSPDRTTMVQMGQTTDSQQKPVLIVTNFVVNQSTIIPIDASRMRFTDCNQIDSAWIDHHFMWSENNNGSPTLKERHDFTPLAHHGDIVGSSGEFRYRVTNVQPEIVNVIAEVMKKSFKGTLQIPDPKPWYQRKPPCGSWLVDGHSLELTMFDEASLCDSNGKSEELIRKIGSSVDKELSTGVHDKLFKD